MLITWIKDQNQCNIPNSKHKKKPCAIFEELQKEEEPDKAFIASFDCFATLGKDGDTHNMKISSEAASADATLLTL